MTTRKSWSWYLSAPFYKLTYIDIAHQIDDDLFAYLGERTRGAVVADCGCGPGILTEKFLQHEAKQVFAIDGNPGMLSQVNERLPEAIEEGRVEIIQSKFEPQLFNQIRNRLGNKLLDIIVFKRSLYGKPAAAENILRAAASSLRPQGILVVIHAERSIRRYAFGKGLQLQSYTPYHLFNRTISRIGEILGVGRYTLYTAEELVAFFNRAVPGQQIERIPSRQTAYNLIALHRRPFAESQNDAAVDL